MPGLRDMDMPLNSSGLPRPYMHETLATTITSFLSARDAVAESLSLSISSLIAESFAMYVSV